MTRYTIELTEFECAMLDLCIVHVDGTTLAAKNRILNKLDRARYPGGHGRPGNAVRYPD